MKNQQALMLEMNGHLGTAGYPETVELREPPLDAQNQLQHELDRRSVISQNELTTPLLDQRALKTEAQGTRAQPNSSFRSQLAISIAHTFRVLGLNIVLLVGRWWFPLRKSEPKHVPILANRPAATLASLLHILPVSACLALIGLTRRGYYIGGELSGAVGQDEIKFLGLQLAAKLHEIAMVASLAQMVVSSVRWEIKSGRPIPFAALAAGLQFDSISYLWSKEFLSICLSAGTQNYRVLPMVVLIVVCSVLGVTVAPASATAMQPVLDYWPAGGTDIWLNGSIEALYPAALDRLHVISNDCEVANSNEYCPSIGWESLGANMLSYFPRLQSSPDGLGIRYPDSLQVTARSATLEVSLDVRQPVYDRYTYNYTVSTAQHAVMAEALSQNTRLWDLAARNSTIHGETRFYYRQEAKYTMSSNNALVHVRCHNNGFVANRTGFVPLFPDFGSEIFDAVPVFNATWMDWIDIQLDTGKPNLLWVDLPPNVVRRASLGVIAVVPTNASKIDAQIWGCSVDARWANTEITSDSIRRFTQGQPWSFHINGSPLSSWLWQDYFPRIEISSAFAQYLNPRISTDNSTVFSQLCTIAGVCDLLVPQIVEAAPALEATLNLMVINGLVRLAPTVTVQGTITNWNDGRGPWWRQFMPASAEALGWGGNAYNITPAEVRTFMKTQMRVTAKGYAYRWSGSAVKTSMTILGIYVVIAIAYVCFTVATGFTSSSWDNPCEIIALAANSVPPHGLLQNTGAGISKLSTLGQPVCIESVGSVLQLTFGPDRIPKDRKIKPNTAYG